MASPSHTFPLTTLTTEMLQRLLGAVTAGTRNTAEDFLTAARFIQDAAEQLPSRALCDLLEAVNPKFAHALGLAVDFAIDFHQTRDGDRLGLWLWPVVVTHEVPLSGSLSLQSVKKQMGGVCAEIADVFNRESGSGLAWCIPVQRLLDSQLVVEADLSELLSVSARAQRDLRSGRAEATLKLPPAEDLPPGMHVYFLPVVVRHPTGCEPESMPRCPALAERINQMLAAISSTEVPAGCGFNAMDYAAPFSIAMVKGRLQNLYLDVTHAVDEVTHKGSLMPAGISAVVGQYQVFLPDEKTLTDEANRVVEEDGAPGLYVALTTRSRLTGEPVFSMDIQLASESEAAEAASMIRDALVAAGVKRIMVLETPLSTVWCPDCQAPHLAVPAMESFESNDTLH